MEKLKSEGECIFCEKKFGQSGLGRHLTAHLKTLEKESTTKENAFHLYIPAGEMFLHLLVNQRVGFEELDDFLRAIWLECCGHMSSFRVKGKRYNDNWDEGDIGESKNNAIGNVLGKGMKIEYEYDFGSTTQLEIRVVGEYHIPVPDHILLLSRNEPLPILCHLCEKKPAVCICSICVYEGESMFCESCAKKHGKSCSDFADYARLEVVNSPRMGVCAYEGGQIDLERDGVWKGEK